MSVYPRKIFAPMESEQNGALFPSKDALARDWLPRYTGTPLDQFGRWILLTNFQRYVQEFATRHKVQIYGLGGPMTSATSAEGITIINYGMGSANAATIMDLLIAAHPDAILFLGKCGGLKKATEIGHFILPIGAVRGEGTPNAYMPPEVPALPSFKLHQYVAGVISAHNQEYRTGVIYTTNRRLWEHDKDLREYLRKIRVIGIDMETATIFIVGHANRIPRGALLLVSDTPMESDGIKTGESDREINNKYVSLHLEIGIESLRMIAESGENIKHFLFE